MLRVVPSPQYQDRAANLAERRAWVILWMAFATFCALLVVGAKVAVDYVATAEIDLTARLESTRGLAFMQVGGGPKTVLAEPDLELLVGTSVEAARAGAATVRLFDGSRVTLQSGARVDLARMDVGRFIARQTLLMRQHSGPVAYETIGDLEVDVPDGSVRLVRANATVWIDEGRTRVLVYEGEAHLRTGGSSLAIRADQRGELTGDGRLVGPSPRGEQLLRNGDFNRRAEEWEPIDVQSGPPDVDGQRFFFSSAQVQGRQVPALRVVRESQTLAHGETGLRQKLNVNVSGYRGLYVEAWVRVDRASLSGGGRLGSEYPMMLRVVYEGVLEGSRPDWVHGFYYANPEERPVINAELVPQFTWVRYRVNLMDTDESRRPFHVLGFEVMGQGHSYDAWVADVRLVGD